MAIRHRLGCVAVCGVVVLALTFTAKAADVGSVAQPFERFSPGVEGAAEAYTATFAGGPAQSPRTFFAGMELPGFPQNPPAGQTPQPANQNGQGQAPSNGAGTKDGTGTGNDRLFFALPNMLTVESSRQVPPMTAGQKFKVVARSSFDWAEYPWYAALAGISQAQNSEPGYGQGLKGYAKRYGSTFADGTIENFWVSAIFPSILHDDPRFYQMADGSVMHRMVYAASRMLITRTDSGHRTFNFSEVFGAMIAATISTYSYHPHADRTIANTASVWGSEIGYDTVTIEIKEFWPAIHGAIVHKKANPAQAPSQP